MRDRPSQLSSRQVAIGIFQCEVVHLCLEALARLIMYKIGAKRSILHFSLCPEER
jgi:hypothetical protein